MLQNAIVRKILDHNIAEIEVVRQTACGHDCSKCGAMCNEKQIVTAKAINKIGAKPGDQVQIEGDNKQIYKVSAIVYIMPLVLFFVFYAIAAAISHNSTVTAISGGVGFVIGILYAVFYSKRLANKNEVNFVIVNFN